MTIACPHCRTEYDAEENEYGRFVKCEVCQKGFVAGTSMPKREPHNVTTPVRTTVEMTSSATCGVATGPRWITIHGYREWFLWRNPVQVFRNSGQTPICDVPHNADVAILAQTGDTLRFKWEAPLGWYRRECQLVVGDCNDVLLSFRDRKDWILCATATSDIRGRLRTTARKNAWVKVLALVCIVALVAFLITVITDDRVVTLQKQKWFNFMLKTNMADDARTGDIQPKSRPRGEQPPSATSRYSVTAMPARSSYATTGSNHPTNAKEAIRSARENVKRRYHQNLERLYLAESLYYERDNMCELILVHPSGDSTLYHIRYWKSSNQLEWSRSIPKYVAEQFISDRMLISDYAKVLDATP